MRHLISLKEQSAEDIREILDIAATLKKRYRAGETTDVLHDKTLLMFFQKGSTRTRISFEAGMTELGGHAICLDAAKTQFALADFRDEIRAANIAPSIVPTRTPGVRSRITGHSTARCA